MTTKTDKKKAIRQDIIDSAGIYSQNLAGKAFLYVYGEEFFEVSFPVDHFLHLAGVETHLSAKDFYKNAKKGKLTDSQFYFDVRHPYANAKKKLPCLKRLPELTNDTVCILKDIQTVTIIYKLSVTNLEFTLGLTENTDIHGNKINDFFLPMSLRVEDSSVEKSNDGDIVDFIFAKDASRDKYVFLLVEDKRKSIPECIKHLISPSFYNNETNE
ncbi:MAG: PBECR4 domain-containing protein [Blautia sp.]|nr:PBECR4 domain-containing protein [Blautia sp.]